MANYNLREVLKQLGRNILSWVKSNCVNNCTSTTTNLPLAAAQGKALQDQITALNSNIEVSTLNGSNSPHNTSVFFKTIILSLDGAATNVCTYPNPYPSKGKPSGGVLAYCYNRDNDVICSYDYEGSTANTLRLVVVKRGSASGAIATKGSHRFFLLLFY